MIITENDIKEAVISVLERLIREGIEYNLNNNNTIDAHINTDSTDAGNTEADTRIWGTKSDILYGDGTSRGKMLSAKSGILSAQLKAYKKIMMLVQHGKKTLPLNIADKVLNSKSKNAIIAKINEFNSKTLTDEEIANGLTPERKILAWAEKMYDTYKVELETSQNKIGRLKGIKGKNDKAFRFDTGTVPGTDVGFISLFRISDFNFSDVIKHGEFRQNGNTDKLLNIDKAEREKEDALLGGNSPLRKIPATYDGGKTPNVANNFSLSNVNLDFDNDNILDNSGDHFKKQYGFKDGEYTSITQFMDKSIMYAARALKEVGFKPDVIIAPPSSSKYNMYYCTNLSRKLGIPYINDFFDRNVVNVSYDKDMMIKAGMSPADIMLFENKVKAEIYNEITLIIADPIIQLANTFSNYFSQIRTEKRGRFLDFNSVKKLLCQMSANALIKNMGAEVSTDYLYKMICFKLNDINFGGGTISDKFFNKKENFSQYEYEINKIVHSRAVMESYKKALGDMHQRIILYKEQLESPTGIKLKIASKKFKITDFDKRERKFLSNVYVVADKNLKQNGQLFDRLANSNFLIFDEDMNSGATLKLSIDALLDKLPSKNTQQIKCLVNAYSAGGR